MKYFLIPNQLTPDPEDRVARVTQQETANFTEVIKLTTRRGLSLTDTELTSALNELKYTIIDLLNSGKAVETPFARFRPSIGGVFYNNDDVFDPGRHTINISCLVGKEIIVDTFKIPLEKVKYTSAFPYIDRILNYSTQEENSIITPGGAAEISGELLKIDVAYPLQGLFFMQGGIATKVQVIMRNLPSDIIFNIPATLTPGEYQLEIRNKTNKNDLIMKNYLLSSLLTVK